LLLKRLKPRIFAFDPHPNEYRTCQLHRNLDTRSTKTDLWLLTS